MKGVISLHRTTLRWLASNSSPATIMQQTIFSVRKVEKNLDKLRFYWANMRKKAARPAIPKRGSNHSPFFPAFLLTTLYTTFTMLDTFGAFIQTKAQKYVTIMLRLDLPLHSNITVELC